MGEEKYWGKHDPAEYPSDYHASRAKVRWPSFCFLPCDRLRLTGLFVAKTQLAIDEGTQILTSLT